jgi:hypothetical protein
MPAPTLQEMALWPAPNYINPHTLVPAVYGATIAFTVLMLPFVFARMHTRLRSRGHLGIDDYIILGAAVFSVGSVVLAILATKYGLGYLIWDVKPEWVPPMRKVCGFHTLSFVLTFYQPDDPRRLRAIHGQHSTAQNLSLLYLSCPVSIAKKLRILLRHDSLPLMLVD